MLHSTKDKYRSNNILHFVGWILWIDYRICKERKNI